MLETAIKADARTERQVAYPEPLFILCPPRSYSSIVCGILGQHPQCYGLPELNLFLGDTLGEVWTGFGTFMKSFGRHGLLRTLAQLHDGVQNEETVARAQEWILARTDWPIRKVFDHIQELVGPRILIDKSPSTLFRAEFLERALKQFPDANYLHLVRHPRSTAASVLSLRAAHEQIARMANNALFDPERIWRVSHELSVTLTEPLPLGQSMRLKGEAMLANLEIYLPQICEWLGIRSDPEAIEAMMHPENSPYACEGPPNAPRGNDPNFLENPSIDTERLARIREASLIGELSWRPGENFDPRTVKLARQLGYS
ncbi:sulfotransferase family protein [Ancylobacter pratisalsi]|uniref:Sulfotransferase n=1 Tax=Ancylobacter pratisalsi TaxID=1745854 RepID=A0A6P1YU94_9HYPH|nr:sulfotransferase [Ancylobacter pratisalsi]QIB35184.1 sulfotransferase [Ancylobacter pratisalsi]